jgi:hypothetical protein
LFGRVLYPPAVGTEIDRNPALRAQSDTSWLVPSAPPDAAAVAGLRQQHPGLGGETEAIILARQLATLLIIDERRGRAIARAMGIRTIGLLGLLPLAKERGLLSAVAPYRERLHAVRFRFAEDLWRSILEQAGEGS